MRRLTLLFYQVWNNYLELLNIISVYICVCCYAVGEEDEVSIKEVAVMIAEAMDFKGELVVR